MPGSRRRLTLIDLMAAIGAAGVGLGFVSWLAPGRPLPMLCVVPPLAGIVGQQQRGGRGIVGGAWGGGAVAACCLCCVDAAGAGQSLSAFVSNSAELVLMTAFFIALGAALGLVAWLVGLAPRAVRWMSGDRGGAGR